MSTNARIFVVLSIIIVAAVPKSIDGEFPRAVHQTATYALGVLGSHLDRLQDRRGPRPAAAPRRVSLDASGGGNGHYGRASARPLDDVRCDDVSCR
ncbi:hypothetical protein DL770_003696 [Monosporascus sp. CRB-9-2]|nr:hypothetical protein DL770_003696 [Monosporascus sp. CRB-9-2]